MTQPKSDDIEVTLDEVSGEKPAAPVPDKTQVLPSLSACSEGTQHPTSAPHLAHWSAPLDATLDSDERSLGSDSRSPTVVRDPLADPGSCEKNGGSALLLQTVDSKPLSDGGSDEGSADSSRPPQTIDSDSPSDSGVPDAGTLTRGEGNQRPARARATDGPARVKLPRVAQLRGYEILGELGRGGMGVVYKAKHLALNRLVALKMILNGGHAGDAQIRRFTAEAKAVARLRHPNVVQVFEVGEEDGLNYFAMEYVEGGSLESLVRGTPQPAREAAGLVEVLARAMFHVHEQGIVHRDLKPANVLLKRKEGQGGGEAADDPDRKLPLSAYEAKITDFGLAKVLDEQEGMTRTGVVAGTPSYMAPEQASGHTKEAGPAADTYALGAIFYELLTGRPPFKADTMMDTLKQVASEEPVPPTRLQSRVPRDLETICLKCLQKDPRKRYTSALFLAEDLRRFQDGEAIKARPTPAWERAWKWARRRPAVAGLLATVVFVTALGLGLVTWQWLRAEHQRNRAEALASEEARQRLLAVQLAEQEARARLNAQRISVGLLRERGIGLCEQGRYGHGMLWLARALAQTPKEAPDLEASLRGLMGGWGRYLPRVEAVFPHPRDVMAVAISPDGKVLATGCQDGAIRLWDLATGKQLGEPIRGEDGPVEALAFSPSGDAFVTGTLQGVVSVWDRVGGQRRWKVLAHRQRISAVAFSPDGQTIVSAGRDGTARLWTSASGKARGELRHRGPTVAGFTPDGSRVITGGRDRTVHVWDVKTLKLVGPPWKVGREVSALAVSPDGKTAALGLRDDLGHLQLWDLGTGKPLGDPVQLAGATANILFSPGGERIVTGCADGTAQVWARQGLKLLGEPLRHQQGKEITGVAFSPDGKKILTGCRDGTARVWDVSGLLPWLPALQHPALVINLSFSPDGKKLLTLSGSTAQLWVVQTGQPAGPALRHKGMVVSAVFRPDGREVLTADATGVVQRWDLAAGRPVGPALKHRAGVVFAVYSPDGKLVLTGCEKAAQLWDAVTGAPIGEPLIHDGQLLKAQFRPDGEAFLTVAGNNARLWQVSTRQTIGPPLRHPEALTAAVFSPDGKVVATAGFDPAIRFWDAATGEVLGEPLTIPEQGSKDVVFNPSGRTLLTRADKTVRLWHFQTRTPLGEPLRHPEMIAVSLFSADGRIIVTAGGMDQTVRLWDASTGKPLGEPQSEPGPVFFAALSPDNRMLVAGYSGEMGHRSHLWKVPLPLPGTARQIQQEIEISSGLGLDAGDAVRWLDELAWRKSYEEATEQRAPQN